MPSGAPGTAQPAALTRSGLPKISGQPHPDRGPAAPGSTGGLYPGSRPEPLLSGRFFRNRDECSSLRREGLREDDRAVKTTRAEPLHLPPPERWCEDLARSSSDLPTGRDRPAAYYLVTAVEKHLVVHVHHHTD